MKTEVVLPSNRKFGLILGSFFPAIFYLFVGSINAYFYGFFVMIFILGIFNSKLLTPLNFMWMQLGVLLGRVTSPIALSFLYFLVLTPFALLFRLIKRDELRLHPDKLTDVSFFHTADDDRKFSFDEQF